MVEAGAHPEVDLPSLVGLSHHEFAPALAYARRALHLALSSSRMKRSDGSCCTGRSATSWQRANQLQEGTWHLERTLELALFHADESHGEVVEVCAHLGFAYYFQAAIGRTLEIARMRLQYAQRARPSSCGTRSRGWRFWRRSERTGTQRRACWMRLSHTLNAGDLLKHLEVRACPSAGLEHVERARPGLMR